MVMEEAVPPLLPLGTTTDFGEDADSSTTEDSSIVVLGKGTNRQEIEMLLENKNRNKARFLYQNKSGVL